MASEVHEELKELEEEVLQYEKALEELQKKPKFDQEAANAKLEELRKEEEELEKIAEKAERDCQIAKKIFEEKLKERDQINEKSAELYKKLRDNHRF